MTTISGSAITPTAVILSTLRTDILSTVLGDPSNTYFSNAQVEQWINDAIKLYTFEIQAIAIGTITTTADQHQYTLPSRFDSMISVEYPTTANTPTYLTRMNSQQDLFWQKNGRYDILLRNSAELDVLLVISDNPSDSETISITYKRRHDYTLTASSEITVPEIDHPVLKKYVEWQATILLQQQEQPSPTSNSSLLMSMYAQSAGQLKAHFDNLLARASQRVNQGQSAVISWFGDNNSDYARIY